MRALQLSLAAVAILVATSCSMSMETEVRAFVGPNVLDEQFAPGDPLAGGTVLVLDGDDVVFESVLDASGRALVEVPDGVYHLQVRLDRQQDPLCFWGDTKLDVELPSTPIEMEAWLICAGG